MQQQIKHPRPINTKQRSCPIITFLLLAVFLILLSKENPETNTAVKCPLVVKEGKPVQISLICTCSNCLNLFNFLSGRFAVLFFMINPVKAASKVTFKRQLLQITGGS